MVEKNEILERLDLKQNERTMNSLSTSIDSVLDDEQVNFVAGDEHIRVHSVDLSGKSANV